jgi:hypothetical protein
VSPRDRSSRISALVILGGLLVAGLVVDATLDDGSSGSAAAVEPGIAMPAARPEPTLASTWYCAAGSATLDGKGIGDEVVFIANPSDRARTATLTVLPGTVAPPPAPAQVATGGPTTTAKVTTTTKATTSTTEAPTTTAPPPQVRELKVGARSRLAVHVSDIATGALVGVVVEVDGGDVSVEHELTNADLGRTTSPCSTTVSTSWSFPWGVTTRGNRELMVFMNPFPDDATVDISFATDEGVRDTGRFTGFVVPGRSVVGAFIDEDVTRKEQVSAQVTVRGGRLVVERVQTFTGIDGREGITVGLGGPVPALAWAWPDGLTGPGLTEQVVVYNPHDRVAEAQVEVRLDDPDENGVPEPFELTIPPQRYAIVDLEEEDRIPAGIGHAIVVRSVNGVTVVAERAVSAGEGASRHGVATALGSPLAAPTWYFPGGGTSPERDEFLTLLNVSDDHEVTYSVTALASGQSLAIQGLQDVELAPGARVVIRLGDHVVREDLPIQITADGPIVAERGLYRVGGDGLSQAIGIPLATDAEVIPEPK